MKHILFLLVALLVGDLCHAAATNNCPPPPPKCTYTYSDWTPSVCPITKTQTRTIVSVSPSTCVGTPILTQSCVYVTPPSACAHDFTPVINGDMDNPMSLGTLYPASPLSAPGDLGRSIRFVADSTEYPNGLRMITLDEVGTGSKELVISQCPHDFTPYAGYAYGCQITGVQLQGTLLVAFGPQTQKYECPVPAGATAYLNYRSDTPPRGSVATLLLNYIR
jgi:hypothetical protein